MTNVKIEIKTDKAIKKPVKPSGTSSRIYLPKEWIGKTICLIPITYDNYSFEGQSKTIKYEVEASRIWKKKVAPSGHIGCIYMPKDYNGVMCLIFEAPKGDI